MYKLPEGKRQRIRASLPATGPSTPQYTRPLHAPTPPSLSAPPPFDWEAARGKRPAPYGTPTAPRKKDNVGDKDVKNRAKDKKPRIIRQMSWKERIANHVDPSQWWDELISLPSYLPLPPPSFLGRSIGIALHVVHCLVKWAALSTEEARNASYTEWADELGWEKPQSNGWGWRFMSIILLAVAVANTSYLFTRTRIYRLHMAQDRVSSSHVTFVAADLSLEPAVVPSCMLKSTLKGLVTIWRLLVGTSTSASEQAGKFRNVQQLEVWSPGEGELALFCVYSPVHALTYLSLNLNSWFLTWCCVMIPLSLLLLVLVNSFNDLVKDRAIIASEVLHEYDEKFVYPLLNPLKKDAETMTHEAEMVDMRRW